MFWRFFIGALLAVVCGDVLDSFLKTRADSWNRQAISFALQATFIGCMIGAFVASCLSQRFRCPRCGKKFVPSFASTWTLSDPECIHCGLKLEE